MQRRVLKTLGGDKRLTKTLSATKGQNHLWVILTDYFLTGSEKVAVAALITSDNYSERLPCNPQRYNAA